MEPFLTILTTMNQIRMNGVEESEYETQKFIANLKHARSQISTKPNITKEECNKIYRDQFLIESSHQMQSYQEMQSKMENDYTTRRSITQVKISKIASEQKKISKSRRCDFRQTKRECIAAAVTNVATPPVTNRQRLMSRSKLLPTPHPKNASSSTIGSTPLKYQDGFAIPMPSNHKKRVVQRKTNRLASRNNAGVKFPTPSPRNRRMGGSPNRPSKFMQQTFNVSEGGSLSQPCGTTNEPRNSIIPKKRKIVDTNHASDGNAPKTDKRNEPPSAKRRRIDDKNKPIPKKPNESDDVALISGPVIVFSSGDSGCDDDMDTEMLFNNDKKTKPIKMDKMDVDSEVASQNTTSTDTSFTSFLSFTDDSTAPIEKVAQQNDNRPRPSHHSMEAGSHRNSDMIGESAIESSNHNNPSQPTVAGTVPTPTFFTQPNGSISPIKRSEPTPKKKPSIQPNKPPPTQPQLQTQPKPQTQTQHQKTQPTNPISMNSNLVIPNLSTAASFIPDIPKSKKDEKKKIRVPALEMAARQREKQMRKEAERKAQRDAMKTKKDIRKLQKKSQKKDTTANNTASTTSTTTTTNHNTTNNTNNPNRSTKKKRLIRTTKHLKSKPSIVASSSSTHNGGNRLSKIKLKPKHPPKLSTIKKPKIIAAKPHRSIKKVKKTVHLNKMNDNSNGNRTKALSPPQPNKNGQSMWISAQNVTTVNNKENQTPKFGTNTNTNTKSNGSKKKAKHAQTTLEYELSDYDSEFTESDVDEDACVKHIPDWARHRNVSDTVREQSTIDPDRIYGKMTYKSCDLEEIFKNYPAKPKYRQRSASGDWTRDRVTYLEEHEYKVSMGWVL